MFSQSLSRLTLNYYYTPPIIAHNCPSQEYFVSQPLWSPHCITSSPSSLLQRDISLNSPITVTSGILSSQPSWSPHHIISSPPLLCKGMSHQTHQSQWLQEFFQVNLCGLPTISLSHLPLLCKGTPHQESNPLHPFISPDVSCLLFLTPYIYWFSFVVPAWFWAMLIYPLLVISPKPLE